MMKLNPNQPRVKDMARRVWLTDNYIFGTQDGMANMPAQLAMLDHFHFNPQS